MSAPRPQLHALLAVPARAVKPAEAPRVQFAAWSERRGWTLRGTAAGGAGAAAAAGERGGRGGAGGAADRGGGAHRPRPRRARRHPPPRPAPRHPPPLARPARRRAHVGVSRVASANKRADFPTINTGGGNRFLRRLDGE
eukprot:3842042-Rhodomonas_salina.1